MYLARIFQKHFQLSEMNFLVFRFGFVILSVCVFFQVCYCVLPPYTPALTDGDDGNRDLHHILRDYFFQGYSNFEILAFLVVIHGIPRGIRTLKRWLKRLGLKRANRRNESRLEDIVSAIVEEMERSVGSFVGYREMTRRLRVRHNIVVRRDTVMRAMQVIDPEGVENRRAHRLQRRKYQTPGPNFLWHLDGWDKLKPYGFCVHGCVDGFSRRILWLEVGSTNNNPNVIVDYFLSTVQQLGGVPRVVRTDKGTENMWVSIIQRLLRHNNGDDLAGDNSVVQGKSSANYWSKLRQGGGGWWMNLFKDLRDSGVFLDVDPLHKECLKFCYMPVLRKELHSVAKLWNIKKLRVDKNADVLGGKPDVLFFVPEVYSTHSYLADVNQENVEACKALYGAQCRDYSQEFEELVGYIVPNHRVPQNTEESLTLFIEITDHLKQLGF